MVQATVPDAIAKWTTSDAADIVQASQTQGDSVQLALSKRQRYDYAWANQSEQDATTSMVQGSRGYRVDTKSEYIYDNSNWRLVMPYIEFTCSSGSVAAATAATSGAFTMDTSQTTDDEFCQAISAGRIQLVNPGIYSIQYRGKENASAACTGQSQLVISLDNTFASVPGRLTNAMFGGALMATAQMNFLRTTASNLPVFFYFYNDSGANRTINGVVSIGRIG